MFYLFPRKNFIFRQRMAVTHYFIFLFPLFFINKITDEHIQCLPVPSRLLKDFQYFLVFERPKKGDFLQDWIFIGKNEARERYPIPAAYARYAEYLDIQLGVEKQ